MTASKPDNKNHSTDPSGTPGPAAAAETVPTVAEAAPAAAFPIVGIGASAGGLAAFEAFFSGMPADTDPGMAFVLVQHLAPDHESILTDLIRRYTRMQVFEVEDGMEVQVNCAYIIPPNRDMAFLGGALQLLEPAEPRGRRLPIDFFFASLAQDQHERAIGVILSGTGSDGTLGVRAIKGEGGLVIAQNPESTEFDGMPLSAIATGLVDFELPPAEIPGQLIAYAAHAFGTLPRLASAQAVVSESALKKIFVLLRAQTSHDFSQYKPSTICRRIERRMAVQQIVKIDGYVKFLQQTPVEVQALFQDLLIGVTSFFRDPEAFQALEERVIPKLFDGKPADTVIRVWSCGCSSGEEAYSLAILLQERMEAIKQGFTVQIFATDIDPRAIATARLGRYPASIAADISAQRLARFFIAETDTSAYYRIHKGIRDMLVFSEQDVLKDPPFSKLDLISCRNLLIYLGPELQKKLIPLFHYALNPGGRLFLGTSEGVGDYFKLFDTLDRKSKLYQRREDFAGLPREPVSRFAPVTSALNAALPRHPGDSPFPHKLPLRELTEQTLLQHCAPPSALVNAQGDILYLYGRTGLYLEPAAGATGISNILSMAREGLRASLSSALRKAASQGSVEYAAGLRVKTNSHFTLVNLGVWPVVSHSDKPQRLEPPLFLVTLQAVAEPDASSAAPAALPPPGTAGADPTDSAAARIAALMTELRAKDEYLQSTREELESSNEELKSSNEEMQSVNEELQSTNEELETSKEELQSVNEELATVNTELHAKVLDLSRANNDMNNLLAGTGIATVFLDHKLRVLRFTPMASQLINLIASDVGRPVGHIVSNLVAYDSLLADVQSVLDTLVPKDVQVKSNDGTWYAMRIRPYRTLDNVIEGAVITFSDITEIKRIQATLEQANTLLRLAAVARDALDAITVQDLDGRIIAWNPAAVRLYGWSEAEALQHNVRDHLAPALREEALARVRQLSQAEVLQPYQTQRLTKAGAVLTVSITATALVNEAGQIYAIATHERARPAANALAAGVAHDPSA